MVALEEKSGDHQSHKDSPSGQHEYLHQIVWQSIQQLLRYFSLDQSGGPTDRHCHPQSHAASSASHHTSAEV